MANEIAKRQEQAMARPNFVEAGDATGTEGIGAEDVRLPRIAIAQGLSPQMLSDSASYIEDLKMTDMFNDLTGEIYGKGPLKFIPVRRDVRRIEFRPRDEGGGVLDLDVPPNDPRNEWTDDEDGNRIPPAATKFTEFVILILREDGTPEPVVLSLKETNKFNRAAATNLSSFIKFRRYADGTPTPIYGGLYTVESKNEKNDSGTFGIYVVKNAGFITDLGLYVNAKTFHYSLIGKTIDVQREPGEEDTFDTTKLEPEM